MQIANTKTSHLISTQLPFFVRNDHAQFVRFLEAYYEYLEQDDKVGNVLKNARKQYDIDLAEDEYADLMYATFMKFIPTSVIADKKILIKNIKDFYRAKGTEKATRFLFRILYNLEIEFYYPKLDVLRASDGKWYIQKSLRVTDIRINSTANTNLVGLEKFVTSRITANVSNASALVERVDRFYEGGLQIDELVLSNISGDFESGESVIAHFDEGDEEKVITANIFGGIINSVTIDNPGTGYQIGDPVVIVSSTGNGACAVVSSVSTGSIEDIGNFGGGAGYQVNNNILITGGGGSGANGVVSTVILTEQYHPNTYNIVGDTLGLEGNTVIGNTTSFETFAYQNLATLWTNTSNLVVNTGAGTLVTTINLSHWKANSNVFFETYDSLNVNNTIVLITSSNIRSNVITISPGIAGGLLQNSFVVIKKPNISSIIASSMNYWQYANTGPVGVSSLVVAGSGYSGTPTVSVVANTTIQQLGILGRMEIENGGQNYQVGDLIEFINPIGSYGFGALANVTNVNPSQSNTITGVYWKQVSGFPLGGAGFNPDLLPTANVISATGNGANIQVIATLGTGADLRPTSSEMGAILRVLVLNRGSGYTVNTTIDLSGSGDGTANGEPQVVEGLFTYPGRYLNDDGHLSSFNFLQDRDFYQSFSYVIRSAKSIAKYRKAVKELIHPAGMKLWGEYLYVAHSDTEGFGDANTVQQTYYTANTANDSSPILHLNARQGYPNTGNTWYDTSGYGNSAAMFNITFANNLMQFANSSNSHANVNNWEHTFSSPFTIMAWATFSNTSSEILQIQTMVSNWNNSTNNGVFLEKTSDRRLRFVYRNGASATIDLYSPNPVSPNTFYLIAATLSANNSNVRARMYLNGFLANTANGDAFFTSNNTQLMIGRLSHEGSTGRRGMIGAIGDVLIYDKDLSASVISAYFANTSSRYGY